MNFRTITLAIIAALAITACKKRSAEPEDLGYSYVPLAVGNWVEYEVDSIDHNDFNGSIDTFYFQVREVIESEFLDDEARPTVRVEQFVRWSDTAQWSLRNVYTMTRTESRLERVEENQRYLRLAFPMEAGKRWNGNAFNNEGSQTYECTELDVASTINSNNFDSVCTVVQQDNQNIIEIQYYEERYARGVGLVSKTIVDLDLQSNGGIEYTQSISDWGSN